MDVAGAVATGACTHATAPHTAVRTRTRRKPVRRTDCTARVCAPSPGPSSTRLPLPALIIGSRLQDMASLNSFDARTTLKVDGASYTISRLGALAKLPNATVERLPVTLGILLENLLRNEDGTFVKRQDIEALARWDVGRAHTEKEVAFRTTGAPPGFHWRPVLSSTSPQCATPSGRARRRSQADQSLAAVDLVIDHSVQVDEYGVDEAFLKNPSIEFERNKERYEFLRWGQQAFQNLSVVPPGTGSSTRSIWSASQKASSPSKTTGRASRYPTPSSGPTRTRR